MSKRLYQEHDNARKALIELILQTHNAIEKLKSRGDAKATSRLIFEQRHNLKVLFRQLEMGKK